MKYYNYLKIFHLKQIFLIGIISLKFSQINTQANNNLPIQRIRVIKNYINHVILQCPLGSAISSQIRADSVKWINEENDYNKPDGSVLITSQNLCSSGQINFQLYEGINYLSCGYVLNNCYVRVKIWQIDLIDPSVYLKVDYNPTLINFGYINDTYGTISVVPSAKPLNWNQQLDLLRLKCINNFDYPINTKYIWMYVQNPLTNTYETWHRYDIEPLSNPIENIFQTFYNPDQNRNCPLSDFLKNLCIDCNYQLTFQCASYFEKPNTHDKVFLLADSKNFSLICGDSQLPPTIQPPTPTFPTTITTVTATAQPHKPDNGALIGGIVGGVLGLLLLLCLIGWLLLLCWKLRHKKKQRNCQAINIEANSSSSIVYPNAATASQVMYSNNVADKASQFSNQIEISNMDTVPIPCTPCPCLSNANTIVHHHTCAPDAYLRMITIQKDCCDDNISSCNEMIATHYDTAGYHGRSYMSTDDEAGGCHHHCRSERTECNESNRRDYYIHNYQHQSEQSGGHFV